MSRNNELVRVRVGGTSKVDYKVMTIVAGKPAYSGGPRVVKWTGTIPDLIPLIDLNALEMEEDYVGICRIEVNGKWDGTYKLCLNCNPSVNHLFFVGATIPTYETVTIPTTNDPEDDTTQVFYIPYGA